MADDGRKAKLQEIFHKYATVKDPETEDMYMTTDTFMYTYLDIHNSDNVTSTSTAKPDEDPVSRLNQNQGQGQEIVVLFSNLVSRTRQGLISYSEFEAFEELCTQPDAPYRMLFQLINTSQSQSDCLSLQEFTKFMGLTENLKEVPDLVSGSTVVRLYFGSAKSPRSLTYQEFCQFVHDFQQEFMQRIFQLHENGDQGPKQPPKQAGKITYASFLEIMTKYKAHVMTPTTSASLMSALKSDTESESEGSESQSQSQPQQLMPYSLYSSLVRLLDHMPIVKLIYLKQTAGQKSKELTLEEFVKGLHLGKQYNTNMELTPTELEVLFAWVRANKIQRAKEKAKAQRLEVAERPLTTPVTATPTVKYSDLLFIASDKRCLSRCEKMKRNQRQTNATGHGERSYAIQLQENAYRFFLGALAGAFGGLTVYPIDLVKTRMQNQRLVQQLGGSTTKATATEMLYKNSWDCARKVVRNEGFLGLYRGLPVQLLGVAPEKALKLAVNDFLREKFSNPHDCSIPVQCELVAGAAAGAAQVLVTNPLEIVKIRLQTADAIGSNTGPKPTAWSIVKELGPRGLYKGYRACLLRDSFFTAIYFTGYANLKEQFEDDEGYNSPWSLLTAGVLAGIPASSLATPADVIKTRLQVVPKPGQTVYTGIIDAARKIYREEGAFAFCKGMAPRILRSAPQFGITIFVYELLQRYFYIDFGGRRPKGSLTKEQLQEIEYLKYKATILEDVENQFPSKRKTSLLSEQATRDRIGGYKHAPQIFQDLQTKFGFKYVKK